MSKLPRIVIVASIVMVIGYLSSFRQADAYAVQGGSSAYTLPQFTSSTFSGGWTDMWNNVSSPFENFAQSLGSVNGVQNVNFSIPTTITFTQSVPTGFHEAFEAFDAWLYGIVGFHVSDGAIYFLNGMNELKNFFIR